MTQTIEVKVPDIGDFKDVEVIEVLVAAGSTVAVEQSLITVESDKASMEIPSPAAGTVATLLLKVGDKVSQGSPILMLEPSAAAAPGAAPAPASAAPPPAPAAAAMVGLAATPPAAPAAAVAPAPSAPAPGTGAGTGTLDVVVPDIGDFHDVEVIELLVKPGDAVRVEQSLITVESDKASMEIPSPAAGVVQSMSIRLGDKVSKGSPILVLSVSGGAPAAAPPPEVKAPAAPASPPASASPAAPVAPAASPPSTDFAVEMAGRPPDMPAVPRLKAHASPSVRRFARELGVDLTRVAGTGPKGRITQDDVQGFVKRVMAAPQPAAVAAVPAAAAGGGLAVLAWPQVDFAKFGPVERLALSRIKKISGPNLHRNWVTIPHVTNHEDADITDLEAFRVQVNRENEKSGVKLTMLAFLIRACVVALQKFPEFNSSLDGDSIVVKRYYHIGFAADTPNGLVVPVIRDADKKGIVDIARETSALAAKARDGKLAPADMQGGTFSISSLGGIGGTYFTPIINAPEVAILGVCRSTMRPVWDGKQFAPRLILPLSLSWDHRVVDGAGAARFNALLAQLLADFRRVVL
ncbi:MAG TPA: dihydrolipoyllysine-residue acetyltransferase [Burkholderiaceae bacterium]|nr:dihydrolipoyllysine-residue acetyltransferase [Burkholderiaceae bacterium]